MTAAVRLVNTAFRVWVKNLIVWGRADDDPLTPAAEWAERASGLLAGGITAQRVPEILAGFPQHELRAVTHDWGVVLTVWKLAEKTGSSRVDALHQISHALKAVERLRERRLVLLAGPRSTAILVSVLPAIAWLMGVGMGMNPFVVLLQGWGLLVLLVGVSLWLAGIIWLRTLYKKLRNCDVVAGFECVLMSVALESGSDTGSAARQVISCIHPATETWINLSEFAQGGEVSQAIELSQQQGIPVRQLLLSVAETHRTRMHSKLEAAAERMGVAVLVPLGVCILPAFVALGVIPVIGSMILQLFK